MPDSPRIWVDCLFLYEVGLNETNSIVLRQSESLPSFEDGGETVSCGYQDAVSRLKELCEQCTDQGDTTVAGLIDLRIEGVDVMIEARFDEVSDDPSCTLDVVSRDEKKSQDIRK